jgi:hypothetical protein
MATVSLLSAPLILWVLPSHLEPTEHTNFEWRAWLDNVFLVGGLAAAAVLTLFRGRYWFVAVLAIAAFVTEKATIFFAQNLLLVGGPLNYIRPIANRALAENYVEGFYLVWNLVVLPLVPVIALPLAIACAVLDAKR